MGSRVDAWERRPIVTHRTVMRAARRRRRRHRRRVMGAALQRMWTERDEIEYQEQWDWRVMTELHTDIMHHLAKFDIYQVVRPGWDWMSRENGNTDNDWGFLIGNYLYGIGDADDYRSLEDQLGAVMMLEEEARDILELGEDRVREVFDWQFDRMRNRPQDRARLIRAKWWDAEDQNLHRRWMSRGEISANPAYPRRAARQRPGTCRMSWTFWKEMRMGPGRRWRKAKAKGGTGSAT